jgi:hypothetical protein
LQQRKHRPARDRQQRRVQRHQPDPFAQPDLPARHRLHRHHLHLALLDVPRQRPARQPQRRQPEQTGDGAQRVREENLREPARRAVVLDQQRQPDHRRQQQHGDDDEQPEPEGGPPRQPGDGKQALHELRKSNHE